MHARFAMTDDDDDFEADEHLNKNCITIIVTKLCAAKTSDTLDENCVDNYRVLFPSVIKQIMFHMMELMQKIFTCHPDLGIGR